MPIREIHICGYRSIRDLRLRLGGVNVIVGPNGCGKSNLYRAIHLLAQSVEGRLSLTLAEEGGLPSAIWAGPRKRSGPVRMDMRVEEDDCSYALSCGVPVAREKISLFSLDPEVKEESLSLLSNDAPRVEMLDRRSRVVRVRDRDGRMVIYPLSLTENESALSQIPDPQRYPETSVLRDRFRRWRFYHHFRTDSASPLRQPQPAVLTPVLGHDGHDLASALQTIFEFGEAKQLLATVADAFPNTEIRVTSDESRRLWVQMRPSGIKRWLDARELSDGTLRFLCHAAALLTTRPPSFLAFNEPEASLHPDLILPLARLMAAVGKRSQLWVTTHSRVLADAIAASSGHPPIELELISGETRARKTTALGEREQA